MSIAVANIFTDCGQLFDELDVKKQGLISRDELISSLRCKGYKHVTSDQIDKLFEQHFTGCQTRCVTRDDFISQVQQHELKLYMAFVRLDVDKDGLLNLAELRQAFVDHNISITDQQLRSLCSRMCKLPNSTAGVSFVDWRDYLLFQPSTDVNNIIKSLTTHTYVDFGEDVPLPDELSNTELTKGQWLRHLIAGGVAGAVSRTVTAPIDRIKIFFQVHGARKQLHLISTIKYMWYEGGLSCFWRGNWINVLKIAPENAIKFGSYEVLKLALRGEEEREIYTYERFLAGSLAGAIAQTVIFPLEVVKIRMALRKTNEFDGTFDCIRKIYRRSDYSYRVFYRGYLPNLLGILPYAGIDLTVFETLSRRFNVDDNSRPLTILSIGAFSSCCGQLAAYPFAVIRTKLQSQAGLKKELPAEQTTPWKLFRYIYRTEGIHGLYRGLLPNMCKVAPAMGVSYYMYGLMRSNLGIEMS